MYRTTLAEWFATPLGAYVLERELAFCDEVVADIFGFNALQLGLAEIDYLRTSRMPLRFSVGSEAGAQTQQFSPHSREPQAVPLGRGTGGNSQSPLQSTNPQPPLRVRAREVELPVATQSMDLVLLPHVLEFAPDPHQILREIDRVMMPEGRIIVLGFNPWSLWGLRHALGKRGEDYPWCGDFISLVRLKDWLALLGFDVSAGRLACYAPPLANPSWLARFNFMEPAGDRWWGIAGGIYMVQAIKRVQGMRLITPKWKGRRVADKAVAPLSRRSGQDPGSPSGAPSNVIALPRRK